MIARFFSILFALILISACGTNLFAAASVTAATGGGNISANTAGGAYTTITGPKLVETDKAGIGLGSIILTAPAGFEFDPAATVNVAVTGSRKGTNLALSNSVATVTANTITVYVTATSSPNPRRSILTWSGIKVRPKFGSPLAAGNITRSGTSAYSESGSTGNYGTLTEVAGTMSNLVVTLPNQTFTSGIGVSGTPAVQTSGIPFNLTTLIAADRFLNIITNYNGSRTISYAGPGGTPAYTTNVVFTNGQSSTMLVTTLRKAETTTITVGDGTIFGPASSPLTINRGAFTKLQLLVPGETAAPGTLTGKTGTPSAQTAGSVVAVTVRAVDDNWNLVDTATDTVGISVSDVNASLPANAALVAGTATFNVVLITAGAQTVTASNLTTPAIAAGTSPAIPVTAAALRKMQILVPGETAAPGTVGGKTGVPDVQVAGSAFNVTVRAVDVYWNTVPVSDFAGMISSDANATLPANSALENGSRVFSVTLNSSGTSTLTAFDLSNATITNQTSPSITVMAGPFRKLLLLVPGESPAPGTVTGKSGMPWPQRMGVAFPITVNAMDDQWNLITTVTDTVHFTSSDGLADLPVDAALVNGTQTFSATLRSSGSRTITAYDFTDGTKMASTSSVISEGIAVYQPATGGSSISADTTGGAYTSLTGPVIAEGASGNVGTGTIIFTVSPGFVIDTGTTVRVTVTGTGDGNDLSLVSTTATVSPTTITVAVNTPSTSNRTSMLTWSGIRVRPTAGTPLASGNISISGSASIMGITGGTSLGTLREAPGTGTRLAIQTPPSSTVEAGAVWPQQPVIRIVDQFGNLCAADNSTVLTVTQGTGAGALQGMLSAIAMNGVVSFLNLSHQMAGTITLSFSGPGLTGVTSDSIVVAPTAASQLAFIQSPTDAVAGAMISPVVAVQVEDVFGNPVTTSGVPIAIVLSSGTGILSGTTSNLTDASGVANFPELSIDRIGSKVLTVSAPGLVAAGSEAFTISPAAACQLAFIQSPTDAVAGVTISPAVVVQVEDAFSNPVATSGVPVSLTISTGLGTLDGTTLQSTDSGGIATFGDLQIAAAGVKQLTAARDGLIPVVSSLFTIAPGDYTRVQLLVPGEIAAAGTATGKSGSPTAQIAGTAFTVRVNAVDAFWNIINTVSNTVDIYSSDAGAVLPANASLVAGTNTFNITLNTVGTQSITAEDFVDATIADDTSPDILVATTLRTLRVTSAHGTAVPAPGAYTTVAGAVLTNSVTSPDTQGSTQYVCTGWVMTGNEPFSGTGNQFVMTITNDSSLTWLWATNYWLGVTAGPNGSVMGATNGWYGLGAPITVTAAASPYYHLEGWSGDVQGDTNNAGMTLIMDRPRAVSAAFTATLAAGGTPYWWLAQYELIHDGLSYDAAETNDADKDGALNWEEYVADTDPTNSSSVLDAINVSNKSLTNTVFFASSSNRVYGLMMATNLLGSQSWMDVGSVTNRGTGGILSLYDTNATGPRYYRVKVKLAP